MKKLIVGLGNVGAQFNHTPHNVGIEALRLWGEKNTSSITQPWHAAEHLHGELAVIHATEQSIGLLFPHTMMNDSGSSVAAFLKYYSVDPRDTLIVHDDIELAFGTVDLRQGGSAKGHNGVRSIQRYVDGETIWRLRLGVGRPEHESEPLERFVLRPFSKTHQQKLKPMFTTAGVTINSWLVQVS